MFSRELGLTCYQQLVLFIKKSCSQLRKGILAGYLLMFLHGWLDWIWSIKLAECQTHCILCYSVFLNPNRCRRLRNQSCENRVGGGLLYSHGPAFLSRSCRIQFSGPLWSSLCYRPLWVWKWAACLQMLFVFPRRKAESWINATYWSW